MQQKVADQQEALEIAIKLETTPVGDNSGIADTGTVSRNGFGASRHEKREIYSRRGLVYTM